MATDLTLRDIMRRFSTEEAARAYFERVRWANGPVCPHCGNADSGRIYVRTPNAKARIRPGLFKCGKCHDTFTVTVGTVMEDSKIPLNKWLIAFYMMCVSKTQISALQLQRQLEIGSYRTALFLCHRIRYALKDISPSGKLGGDLNTDESPPYRKAGKRFASHAAVNHSADEYPHYDYRSGRTVSTNTVEGFFGNIKRSLDGTHHHVSRQHLHLYTAELDLKYNTRKDADGERTTQGIRGIEGKRLMMHRPEAAK